MAVHFKKLFSAVACYPGKSGIDENVISFFVSNHHTIRQVFNQIPKTLLAVSGLISNNMVFPHGVRHHESSLLETDNTVANLAVSRHLLNYKEVVSISQAPVMGMRNRLAKRNTRFLKPSRQRFNLALPTLLE